MGEKLGFAKMSDFGWDCFPFLASKISSSMEDKI